MRSIWSDNVSLATAALAKPVQITGVRGNSPLSCRLMELGFVAGVEACIVGAAPLGDPLQIRLGDSKLSIRRDEAALIDIAAL